LIIVILMAVFLFIRGLDLESVLVQVTLLGTTISAVQWWHEIVVTNQADRNADALAKWLATFMTLVFFLPRGWDYRWIYVQTILYSLTVLGIGWGRQIRAGCHKAKGEALGTWFSFFSIFIFGLTRGWYRVWVAIPLVLYCLSVAGTIQLPEKFNVKYGIPHVGIRRGIVTGLSIVDSKLLKALWPKNFPFEAALPLNVYLGFRGLGIRVVSFIGCELVSAKSYSHCINLLRIL
jgi:hypothetical protein